MRNLITQLLYLVPMCFCVCVRELVYVLRVCVCVCLHMHICEEAKRKLAENNRGNRTHTLCRCIYLPDKQFALNMFSWLVARIV